MLSQSELKNKLIGLVKNSKTDTSKVNSLNSLSKLIYRENIDSSISLSQEALTLSTQIDYKLGIGTSHVYLGRLILSKGEYKNALEHFTIAMDIWNALKKTKLISVDELASNKASTFQNMGMAYEHLGETEKALNSYTIALNLYETHKIKDDRVAKLLSSIGLYYYDHSDSDRGIDYFDRSQKLAKEINAKEIIASNTGNLGNIYYSKADYPKALENYFIALKDAENRKDVYERGFWETNIGNVFYSQGDFPKALGYYKKALADAEKIGDKSGMARNNSNIGNTFYSQEIDDEALIYYNKALKLYEETNDKSGIAYVGGLMANLYYFSSDLNKAKLLYLKSLKAEKELGDKRQASVTLSNLGTLNAKMGHYKEAESYFNQSSEIASELKDVERLKYNYEYLSHLYDSTGNYKQAFINYKKFIFLRDSLKDDDNFKKQARLELQYDFDKKQIADSIRTSEHLLKEEIKHEQKIKQQKIYTYGGIIGFCLMMGVAFVSFRAYRQKQKANLIIESQKTEVEEKNREILDSITYAKRIQSAILPPTRLVKEYLPQSFILYKPKDIVAGDFYWMEHKNNSILFAAADCTGHGVPGAMVSVICNNGLNRSVREHGLTEPGEILDKTREIVIQEFEKSDEEVKDGMDISLCALSFKTKTLKWAGANNPIWIIRKDSKQVEEIKANKQPIGKYAEPKPFKTHSIDLNKGDSIYVFTDGFQDQFGGEKGKKFKASKMKELLLSIQAENMDSQREIINRTFETWKGIVEQVDDVCVIGVKI